MTENQFRRFRALGYESVLPVIAPFGEIDARSSLKTSDLAHVLGKAPGVLWEKSGKWGGLPGWRTIIATDADADAWHEMGANTGLRLDAGLVSIDIDVENEAAANDEEARAIELLGPSPCRVGAWPRRMLFYRIDAPTSSRNMRWFEGTEKRLVEVQTAGKQVVIAGTHRKTGKPYHWPRPMLPRGELSLVSPAMLSAWFADVRARHEGADEDVERKSRTDRNSVDQGGLRGDTATVQRAVEHLPNGFAHFPKRDDWIRVGYAIKGALSHEPDQGLSVWAEWSDRYERPTPEIYAKEWAGMKPPFELGASWLYDKAQELSGGAFTKASAMFENLGDEIPSLFTAPESEPAEAFHPIKWVDPASWEGASPRPREWEVVHWIPKGEVTLIYGDGGIGKTLIVHQYATCAAAGLNWLDQETRKARVMCFFCEDSEDELMRRQIDINRSLGVTMGALSDGLRIASRKYMDNLLALWDRNTGAMKRQAVWEELLRDAKTFKADVLIIDTIADTYGGSEIDRGQVNAFVKSCLGRLAQEIGGSVIALGHPSMAGKASGSGTSGSTAWSNAARSRLFLRYPKGVDAGNIREMEGMKSNYGPKGALLKLRWNAGAFDVLASNMPNAEKTGAEPKAFQNLDGPAPATSAPVVSGYTTAATFGLSGKSIEGMAIDAVLAALRACSGVALNMKVNSPSYAPKVLLAREADLLAGLDRNDVEKAVRRLDKEGALIVVEVGRTATRHPVTGYAVNDNLGADKLSKLDIFG